MLDYKFFNQNNHPVSVIRSDGWAIPFDQNNRDCIQFLSDWKSGASVKNADETIAIYTDATVIALNLTPIGS